MPEDAILPQFSGLHQKRGRTQSPSIRKFFKRAERTKRRKAKKARCSANFDKLSAAIRRKARRMAHFAEAILFRESRPRL